MIITLYPRFIATSVGAGVPRGSTCHPRRRRAAIPPYPVAQQRPRPTTTAAHLQSGQIRGANIRKMVHYPQLIARKPKEKPQSTSLALDRHKIVTRFCGLIRLGWPSMPPKRDRWIMGERLDMAWVQDGRDCPAPRTVQPAVQCAYTRATRRHSRDPAPCARNDFAIFSPFVYWTEL